MGQGKGFSVSGSSKISLWDEISHNRYWVDDSVRIVTVVSKSHCEKVRNQLILTVFCNALLNRARRRVKCSGGLETPFIRKEGETVC